MRSLALNLRARILMTLVCAGSAMACGPIVVTEADPDNAGGSGPGSDTTDPDTDSDDDDDESYCGDSDFVQCFTLEEVASYRTDNLGGSGVGGSGVGGSGDGGSSVGGGSSVASGTTGAGGSNTGGSNTGGAGGGGSESICPELADLAEFTPEGYFVEGPVSESATSCCYLMGTWDECGRPFLIAGSARQAPVAHSDAWLNEPLSVTALPSSVRAQLTEAWLGDALMEHASVAAFARFTMQLMSLGAPPDMIEASQRASIDEIHHARACFALASRYAGEPIGAGALDMHDAMGEMSLRQIVMTTFKEGCVGETIAALGAQEQLAHATDPQVVATLRKITQDEAAHAELAWRFIGWALETYGEPVRQAVLDAARESRPPAINARPDQANPMSKQDLALAAHGRIGERAKRRVLVEAHTQVIGPCLKALLADVPAAPVAASPRRLRYGANMTRPTFLR